MKRRLLTLVALAAAATLFVGAALAATQDGGVIQTSRSTNTPSSEIKIWSDGRAQLIRAGTTVPFRVPAELAQRFFSDAKAARSQPGTPGHCMKSASFGTTTTVLWHGYTSVDLQCPPFSPPVHALAADVRAIGAIVKIDGPPRRVPLPREPRMIPTASPEVSPT